MFDFIKLLRKETNMARTENGAASYRTTNSACLDLFSRAGAMRNACETDITELFMRAYAEDPDTAMKIMFYIRDIRGGIGERRVFRAMAAWLAHFDPGAIVRNMEYIPEFGRFDDLVELAVSGCPEPSAAASEVIKQQLEKDVAGMEQVEGISLLAKWLPSINASSRDTRKKAAVISTSLGMDYAAYRKTLSRLRAYLRIVENDLREENYTFEYQDLPSKAMFRYRKAFLRNDGFRYRTYLHKVESGEAKMNTDTLMPYDIVASVLKNKFGPDYVSENERMAMDIAWNRLDDFAADDNALVIIDGSASMYAYGTPLPASIAISLGIYFAEHSKGAFAGHFMTFSENPQIVKVQGRDIFEKTYYCKSWNEVGSTDIQKVFEVILKTAVRNRMRQEDLPSTLYIISDMEFDCCTKGADVTNFEYARDFYAKCGYRLPRVVFWNVQSRTNQMPVTMNEQGVILVSGCTPRIFSMIASGAADPYEFMMKTVSSQRYACITV